MRRARRGKVAHIRLSDDEFSAVTSAAKSLGLSVSSFLRSLVLEGAGARPFLSASDRAVIGLLGEEMRLVCHSLNQIPRAVNAGRWEDDSQLLAALDGARAIALAVAAELTLMTKKAAAARRGENS